MELRKYLFENNITLEELSQKIGYSAPYLSLISLNQKIPSKRMARDIQDATNGQVTMKELFEIDIEKGKKDKSKRREKEKNRKKKIFDKSE